MSLDKLVSKTIESRDVVDVPLFLPPEYELDHDTWKTLIQEFNSKSQRPVRLASAIRQYVRQNNPQADFDNLFRIGDIVERDGMFYTSIHFVNNKAGLTVLYIFKAEDLQLVPVIPQDGSVKSIRHVSMTYVPD